MADIRTVYLKKENEYIEYQVLKTSIFKQMVLATWKNVDSMDKALSLKGKIVYAKRDAFQLAEGEYFIADLKGLEVIDAENGTVYGTLKEVINRGASDIYVVETPYGERMMPVVSEFVKQVDINKGVFVTPIDGMLNQ